LSFFKAFWLCNALFEKFGKLFIIYNMLGLSHYQGSIVAKGTAKIAAVGEYGARHVARIVQKGCFLKSFNYHILTSRILYSLSLGFSTVIYFFPNKALNTFPKREI
jgi:hypothetical protein